MHTEVVGHVVVGDHFKSLFLSPFRGLIEFKSWITQLKTKAGQVDLILSAATQQERGKPAITMKEMSSSCAVDGRPRRIKGSDTLRCCQMSPPMHTTNLSRVLAEC